MRPRYPVVRSLLPREKYENLVGLDPRSGKPVGTEYLASSISLAMVAITVVSFCLARRLVTVRRVLDMPLARWIILAVFLDSWIFVLSSTVLQASFGLNSSQSTCDAGILLCLVCYLSSKVLIYFFLVEKVYIVRGNRDSRWKDKLFLFNTLGMILPYCIVIVLTFIFRNAVISKDGQCRIGLKLAANIPLMVFDLFINVYLTTLFLLPLQGLWTFKNGIKAKRTRLHRVSLRTFIGSCLTLMSTLGNLISLLILRGKEPGWVCFAVCNADILFSVLVLHWVTHQDDDDLESKSKCFGCQRTNISNSLTHGSAYRDLNGEKKARLPGQVTTRINGGSGISPIVDIPMNNIVATTEFRRDVESIGPSESGSHLERNNSTDSIRKGHS